MPIKLTHFAKKENQEIRIASATAIIEVQDRKFLF